MVGEPTRGSENRARIVHAGDRHLRRVARRIGRIHAPGREVQAVVEAPLVAEYTRATSLPLKSRRPTGRFGGAELLAELRRERIELRGEVVGDRAGEVAGDVRRAEHVELGQRRRPGRSASTSLRSHRRRLAPANGAAWPAPGNRLFRSGHDALGTDAGPERPRCCRCRPRGAEGRRTEVVRQVQAARVVRIVVRR